VTIDRAALWLSLELAALTTAALLALGLPVASWLAGSRSRSKFLVEAVVALPIVLPPTVLGFYLLTALGPRSALGRAWEAALGERFPPRRGLAHARRLAAPDVLPRDAPALLERDPRGGGALVRPHPRRVRGRAHGRREHPRPDADALGGPVRPRRGARVSFAVLVVVYALQRRPLARWTTR
jgi:hypothetical protein